MNAATRMWEQMSEGQRWAVIAVGGAAVVMTGGVALYALSTGGMVITVGTTTVALGEAAPAALAGGAALMQLRG
jgi:hypothetical protein